MKKKNNEFRLSPSHGGRKKLSLIPQRVLEGRVPGTLLPHLDVGNCKGTTGSLIAGEKKRGREGTGLSGEGGTGEGWYLDKRR